VTTISVSFSFVTGRGVGLIGHQRERAALEARWNELADLSYANSDAMSREESKILGIFFFGDLSEVFTQIGRPYPI
jgi:hypothetical protein